MSEHRIATPVGELDVRVVESRGGLPTALLWHSLFVDSRTWHRVEDELAGVRRLVIVTGPGHGTSGDLGARYTMEDCASAGLAVLDMLAPHDPVDWVGNAWGGHVGIIVAARHPDRCRTLVTVGTDVHSYRLRGRLKTWALLALYRVLGPSRFLRDGVVDALLSPRTRAEDEAAVELVRDCFVSADRRGLANAIVSISLRRRDLTPLLPAVRAPTLFVTGDAHPDWTERPARAAAGLLPQGSVAVLDASAYLGPLERPREVSRLVRDFWKVHAPRPSAAA
jgi:pimeloyl-ACP methyl ester carboxylesterase